MKACVYAEGENHINHIKNTSLRQADTGLVIKTLAKFPSLLSSLTFPDQISRLTTMQILTCTWIALVEAG